MVDPVIKNVQFEQLENYFKQIRETCPDERAFVMYIDSRDDTHGLQFLIDHFSEKLKTLKLRRSSNFFQ